VLDCIFDTVSTLLKGQVTPFIGSTMYITLTVFAFAYLAPSSQYTGGQADDAGQPGADPADHRRSGAQLYRSSVMGYRSSHSSYLYFPVTVLQLDSGHIMEMDPLAVVSRVLMKASDNAQVQHCSPPCRWLLWSISAAL
jgi:hypothetical protein